MNSTPAFPGQHVAYRIAGLTVRSQYAFPNLAPQACDAWSESDVTIRFCADVGEPAQPHFRNAWVVAGRDDFVFRPLHGLSFRILRGRDITIANTADIAAGELRAFLVGSVWGVLCHQRRLMPLHCSAVALGEKAFAFTGPSGAGKSTLAAGLSRSGLAHVCDDVCVLDPAARGMPMRPMPKDLKLWADSAASFGLECGPRVSTRLDKYYVAPPKAADETPLRCAALYVLADSAGAPPSIAPLRGGAQFEDLSSSIYRGEWLTLIRDPAEMFQQIARLARSIKLFRFSRPRDLARFQEGAVLLQSHMATIATQG